MDNVPNTVKSITHFTVFVAAIGVISVAGSLPLPIGIALLSFIACFVRPQWKAGLWMWIAAAALTTAGALTTPDSTPTELLQIGPARPRNLLMQASLAGTFVNAFAYRSQDPRRTSLLVMIGNIVTATGITNTFSLSGKIFAGILPILIGLMLSVNNIHLKPTLKSFRWQLLGLFLFGITFAISTTVIMANKDRLYELGNRMLDARPSMASGSRGIEQPQLGPTFGDAGNTSRILYVSSKTPLYLRQAAYTSYLSGAWGPPLTFRRMAPLPQKFITGPSTAAIEVQRFDSMDRVVYLPAGTQTVVAELDSNHSWAPDDSGPVITGPDAAADYAFIIRNADPNGTTTSLFGETSASEQETSLDVPDELSGALERFITRNDITSGFTMETAQQILTALQREHEYSLTFTPDPGDALISFLDSPGDGAHCVYFASATVLLLRQLGYPARLVSGFLAHEPTGDGLTVRGRDAHAWAEVHIPGRGWTLLEATPATGLPSGDVNSVGWWNRIAEKLLDGIRRIRIELENGNLIFIAIPAIVVMVLVGISILAKRRGIKPDLTVAKQYSNFIAEYKRMCKVLGIPSLGNETLLEHFTHHADQIDPGSRAVIKKLLDHYEVCRYGNKTLHAEDVRSLRMVRVGLRKH